MKNNGKISLGNLVLTIIFFIALFQLFGFKGFENCQPLNEKAAGYMIDLMQKGRIERFSLLSHRCTENDTSILCTYLVVEPDRSYNQRLKVTPNTIKAGKPYKINTHGSAGRE